MKALVATDATQGARRGDSMHCIVGELVWMTEACPVSVRNPEGPCPCGRTFRGMYSDGETSTALVHEIDGLTRERYIDALRASIDCSENCACRIDVEWEVDQLIRLASSWPEGAVIERRLEFLDVRLVIGGI